jgi:hypothetical protein
MDKARTLLLAPTEELKVVIEQVVRVLTDDLRILG